MAPPPLAEQVIAISGTFSGIGRAAEVAAECAGQTSNERSKKRPAGSAESTRGSTMPPETYSIYGEWMDEIREDSLGTRLVELHPTRAMALASTAAAATLYLFARRRR
jgi:hypothetical protein